MALKIRSLGILCNYKNTCALYTSISNRRFHLAAPERNKICFGAHFLGPLFIYIRTYANDTFRTKADG